MAGCGGQLWIGGQARDVTVSDRGSGYGSAMAREKKPRDRRPLPPALPPGTRTVGQLVAETIRFYGRHFWWSLTLGLGPAVATVAVYSTGWHWTLVGVSIGVSVLITASYVGACVLVSEIRPSRDLLLQAFAVGLLIALPIPLLSLLLVIPALMWLAAAGLAVPALVMEGLRPRLALSRGVALGRADYVHALGSLCALGLTTYLTQLLLFALLHSGAKQSYYIASFLASLVISPILFLGGALLYFDQAARCSAVPAPGAAKLE
jgi:hypothetical protein